MHHKIKFLLLIIAIISIGYLGRYFPIDYEAIQRGLKDLPLFYSATLFIILYVVVTFFIWLSKDIFRFTGALLFGAYLSTLFVLIAEIINAFILFFLSRSLGRSLVENSLKGKYRNLDERLGKLRFFWLFVFRATPLIPFRFLDLASGLTKISFKKYLLAVMLGSPVRIFWLQYILAGVGLSILRNPEALLEYLMLNKPVFLFSFIYFILVVMVAFRLRFKE